MNWHTKGIDEVVKQLTTNLNKGLSDEEASKRLNDFGINELRQKKKPNILILFFSKFNDFMIIVLLAAALISYLSSYFRGEPALTEPLIILTIVTVNAILGLVQEIKAEKSLEALKKITAPTAKVRRNGDVVIIESKDLVPGDIIILETGDIVPADARLITASNLKSEEASLTGESAPVSKDAVYICHKDGVAGDMKNMVFSGCAISYGHGEGVVTETGMNTQVGKIAHMIMDADAPETPLSKKLTETGKMLGIGAIILCVLVFIVGVMQKISYFEMFMTSVSLAVAAIPEGLPAIVTIMLAIGVQRMAKRNAIIRKLPAVETLGSATVICSDKTGTLTQNKMKVVEVSNGFERLRPHGDRAEEIISLAALCCDCAVNNDGEVIGDPTEKAIVTAFLASSENSLSNNMVKVAELPFESKRKMMSAVHKIKGGNFKIVTKGAPEFVMSRCTHYYEAGQVLELTAEKRRRILNANEEMALDALRVLAVAYNDTDKIPHSITSDNVEKKLIFKGLIGLLDPPREETASAVKICKRAGIKPVMVTGDHILTASAVAQKIGIMNIRDKAVTGDILQRMSDEELYDNIEEYSVFARVSPAHKVRIVKAFQQKGHVVAMTGDGVNDAPALKVADIGCAMGITGTDVAKNAADIVLTDDNFTTIVEAVKEGRGIYENIRKSSHFLISCNIGEIITIFIGLLMGLPSPLLAIQLLWVNLVTDSLPAIALGLDPSDTKIMERKPYSGKKSLFSDGLMAVIAAEGVMIGMLSLLAFTFGVRYFDTGDIPYYGRTMAFAVLSISQLVHSFNMKSDFSVINKNIFNNKYMVYAFIAGLILQMSVIMIPLFASVFGVVTLSVRGWTIVALLSVMPLILVELQKVVNNSVRTKRKRTEIGKLQEQ